MRDHSAWIEESMNQLDSLMNQTGTDSFNRSKGRSSLDESLLVNVKNNSDGSHQAGCPACMENGSDKSHNHLRIFPDGRFGCAAFPSDSQHRRRIFSLVGRRVSTRRTAEIEPAPPVQVQSWKLKFPRPDRL